MGNKNSSSCKREKPDKKFNKEKMSDLKVD